MEDYISLIQSLALKYNLKPFENPELYIPIKPSEIEDFIINSLEYLEKLGLI